MKHLGGRIYELDPSDFPVTLTVTGHNVNLYNVFASKKVAINGVVTEAPLELTPEEGMIRSCDFEAPDAVDYSIVVRLEGWFTPDDDGASYSIIIEAANDGGKEYAHIRQPSPPKLQRSRTLTFLPTGSELLG